MIRIAAAVSPHLRAARCGCRTRVAYFPVAGRRASARCRGRAGRHCLVHGAVPGRARHPRSEDRQGGAGAARQGRGAAWRDRRAGRRRLDHRGRAERDRARRSEDQRGQAVSAAKGFEKAGLNTATFDKDGKLWFTGQNGIYGRVDPGSGKVDAWKAPKGSAPTASPPRRRAMSGTPRSPATTSRRIDPATGAATVVNTPKPASARAASGRIPRAIFWVSLWHCGRTRPLDPAAKRWKTYALPKEQERLVYSVYVDDATRSGSPISSPM